MENQRRLSSEMQNKYYEAEQSESFDWMEVAAAMQKQICLEFFPEETPLFIEKCLYILRCPQSLYNSKEDQELFHEISLYRKYNRARQGSLQLNEEPPNVPLLDLNSLNETSLYHLVDGSVKPVCLIAGSYS